MDDDGDYQNFYALMQRQIADRQDEIDSLKYLLHQSDAFSEDSRKIVPEVKVLFPSVADIALSEMLVSSVKDGVSDTVSMVFVNAPGGLPAADRKKLAEYVGVRLRKKDIHVALNPAGFPWPVAKDNR